MDEKVDFSLGVYTLEDLALIKVAVALWNSPKVQYVLNRLEMEKIVLSEVDKLRIPYSVRDKLGVFINAISIEWQKAVFVHMNYNFNLPSPFKSEYSNKLIWTQYGTINLLEMASLIVNDARIEAASRFKIACQYCLENQIYSLWEEMNAEEFHNKDLDIIEKENNALTTFWCYKISRELPKVQTQSGYDYAFEVAIHDEVARNEHAAKYFWNKMNVEEKQTSISRIRCAASRSYTVEIICFLLNQMEKKQQLEVIHSCPLFFLEKFLWHPWHPLFFKTFPLTVDILDEKHICSLLDSSTRSHSTKAITLHICQEMKQSQWFDLLVYPNGISLVKKFLHQGKIDIVVRIFENAPQVLITSILRQFLTNYIQTDVKKESLLMVIRKCLKDSIEKMELENICINLKNV